MIRSYSMVLTAASMLAAVLCLNTCSREGNREQQPVRSETVTATGKVVYTCSMHPQVTADAPGACPICNMELVKKPEAPPAHQDATQPEFLTITHRGELLANVSTATVKREAITLAITAFGYLDFAEPARKQISARFNGRIEKLFADASGRTIRKGDALFEIYSPDLVQAQNEYLIALSTLRQSGRAIPGNDRNTGGMPMVQSARRKLELFGVTDAQIRRLDSTERIEYTLVYHSPCAGTIIEKKILEGMYVSEGTPLYDIADMSTLWNSSEISANEIGMIGTGDAVTIETQSFPAERFSGKVNFIYPVVSPESRTIKVRSEMSNAAGKLRPQMYTETTFRIDLGMALTIPGDAIVFAGKRNIAWVKTPEGTFEPREVTVGMKTGASYQILSGVSEGEEIAVTGSYLIDSESQLKSGTVGVYPPRADSGGRSAIGSVDLRSMPDESAARSRQHLAQARGQ